MPVVEQLVTDVLEEGNFDVTSAQALRWLTRRHRKMVSRSLCFRKTVEIGPSVSGQRDYALPAGVVQVLEVVVSGVTYGTGRHSDIGQYARGWLLLSDSEGGVTAAEEDDDGVPEIALVPTPLEDGLTIEVRAAWLPPDLDVDEDSTLKIPDDYHDELVAGAVATGLMRTEARPDLAAPYEQEFAGACEELRVMVRRRYRGPGPALIRVRGYNA